ncbi:patatinlike serine hydrolase [Fusarium sporotrichioides]|uniref:Lysophospholipase NTE1 n=1 Tax=Fusarium sporotrichioides TaxID=5514 RepID=A0A395S1J9_FUSSP|nr:patatinlike serine hydrolase [Fusarium sporotrichioides]
MDSLRNLDSDLFSLVRSYEGTRFVENLAIERLVKDVDYFDISKNTKFDPWSNPSPALIFVLDGEVTVTVHDSISTSSCHSSLQSECQAVSKSLKRNACLNSTSQILDILSKDNTDAPTNPRFGEARVSYKAATNLKLARINLRQSGSIPEDVRSPMIQALLQKLFLVTFPVSETHFGLSVQVSECEMKMTSLSNDSTYDNPFSDTGPSLFDYEDGIPESPYSPLNDAFAAIYDTKQARRRAPSNLSTSSTSRPQSMLGAELYKEAQLPLLKSRSNPNLKLMINTEKPQSTSNDDGNLGVFKSQSILSKTERKRQSIPQFKERTPDTRRIRAQAAKRVINMLVHPQGLNVRSSESMDPAIMDEVEANIEILSFGQGEYVAHHGERYPGVLLVIDGTLEARSEDKKNTPPAKVPMSKINPGGMIGHSSLVHNNKSQFDFRAITKSTVCLLPRTFLRRLTDMCPQMLVVLAARMHHLLPPLISLIDFALDWSTIKAGGEIYKKGDVSDCIYLVIKGRVRISEENTTAGDSHIKEYGPGNAFGVLEFHTNHPRPSAARAIRKSEITQLQRPAYQKLINYAPNLGTKLWASVAQTPRTDQTQPNTMPSDPNRLRTIGVFPLSAEVPVAKCATLLSSALVSLGIYDNENVSFVESHSVISAIGDSVFTDAGNKYLEDYVAHVEQNSNLSILVGETAVDSTWNDICISTADLIILMAMDDADPRITKVEMKLERHGTLAHKVLVLVDDGEDEFCPQAITRPYIQERPWLSNPTSHIERVRLADVDSSRDFERLARRITGRSIAVVFGGGGARGFAHLGTLQALEEEGIPFDIVGGTSMGAFIGALYASHVSIDRTVEAARDFSKVSRWYRYLLDFTMPVLAWTSGTMFTNHVSSAMDQDLDSSDLRLAFYCNATNMSQGGRGQTMYPQARSLWQMVRASMSIPPIFPPFAVEGEGDILVDGCFSANVPVFPALSLGAEIVLAFDVSNTAGAPPPQTLGQSVSGWWNFAQMVLPCTSSRKPHRNSPHGAVGSDGDVWGSLQLLELITFSTNTNEIKAIQNTPECLYMLHDLGKTGTFDMEKFDDIREMGYQGAKRWLRDLKTSGKLDHLALPRGIKNEGG